MAATSFFVLFLTYFLLSASLVFSQGDNIQPTTNAPHKNVWSALSEEESSSVSSLLQRRLNLTGDSGSSYDNYINRIVLLQPNKTDAIQYLDDNSKVPSRYARATVTFGSAGPYNQEYMVGPLPATNATAIQPLTFPFNGDTPGKTLIHPIYAPSDALQFQLRFSTEVEDITKKLWNATFSDGSIGFRFGVPFWEENGRIISWAIVLGVPETEVSSPTLLPRGVTVKFDLTSRDSNDWEAVAWYSRGEYYDSTEAFRAAVFSSGFEKPIPNVNGPWTSTDKRGDPLPLDDLPPPVPVSQGSQRFKLDMQEDYATWMDFSMYYSVSQDAGLSLHDIQYKGNRIIYELSLQEALTHYAGSDPFVSQAVFFDTVSGMGATLVPLVKGYDCPSHATYLNSTFSDNNSTKTYENVICIFEYDAGFPIRRHSSPPTYTSVAKNIIFTIRTIATVGNYDFLIEYNFFYDGAIEVSCRASGYISAAYWDNNPEYGFHIHDHLSGALHDHVLSFKADFDILGTDNSVQKVELVPQSKTYPWSKGLVHNTMKAVRGFVTSEASINWSENDNSYYIVVNKDKPNSFGEYPGYRFRRIAGTSHLTIVNSTDTLRASGYTSHDFHVTRHKDTEPRAAEWLNQFSPSNPLVDFSKFLDGESIEQKDVVVWFNLGMHHMPHTGDLPNTMFSATHSGIRFEPFNYLEGDPSVASSQQVRISYGTDKK